MKTLSIYSTSIETKNCQINIGEQIYEVISAEKIQVKITGNLCRIRTSTPLTMRIPEKNYSHYNIPSLIGRDKFIYWCSNLPTDNLMDLIKNNILKKYQFFHNIEPAKSIVSNPFINGFTLLKELIIHIPVDKSVIRIPASYWKIEFEDLNNDERRFLEFAIDVGLGERNSMGLRFINLEKGGYYRSLTKSTNNSSN